MSEKIVLKGEIAKTGTGSAAEFTQLDWVVSQFRSKFGFDPYPGTLNLELPDEELEKLELVKKSKGIEFVPPDPKYCTGIGYKIRVRGINGCLFLPPKDVNVHSPNTVEIIAPVSIKETLNVGGGDLLEVQVEIE